MLSNSRFLTAFCTVISFLWGCASIQPRTFVSNVDSLSRADAAEKKLYVLLPGGKGVDVNDLQFQEFAAYVDKALKGKGFVKADTFKEAEIAIFLTYAVGDPQSYQYTYSVPTFGQTGVSSSHTSGTVSTYGNSATYSGTTTYMPTYGITGSTTHVTTKTVYSRFLFLIAYDVALYVKEEKMSQVWATNVVSSGSSADLRLVVPYMVAAMKPYLGANTGRKMEVEIPENDPIVQALRGGQLP